MGAGVAAGPHFARIRSRAGEGLGRPGRGFRPRPFGPGRSLGFLPTSCDVFRFPNRFPPETLLPRWVSGQDLPRRTSFDPFAVQPRRSGLPDRLGKVGSACASRFFPNLPVPPPVLHDPCGSCRWSAAVAFSVLSFRCQSVRSSFAKFQCDSASRVAPSGIFAPMPVDNGDIVDKCRSPAGSDKLTGPATWPSWEGGWR